MEFVINYIVLPEKSKESLDWETPDTSYLSAHITVRCCVQKCDIHFI